MIVVIINSWTLKINWTYSMPQILTLLQLFLNNNKKIIKRINLLPKKKSSKRKSPKLKNNKETTIKIYADTLLDK